MKLSAWTVTTSIQHCNRWLRTSGGCLVPKPRTYIFKKIKLSCNTNTVNSRYQTVVLQPAWVDLYNCTRKVVLTAAFWPVNLLTDGALATDDAAAAAATRIL